MKNHITKPAKHTEIPGNQKSVGEAGKHEQKSSGSAAVGGAGPWREKPEITMPNLHDYADRINLQITGSKKDAIAFNCGVFAEILSNCLNDPRLLLAYRERIEKAMMHPEGRVNVW